MLCSANVLRTGVQLHGRGLLLIDGGMFVCGRVALGGMRHRRKLWLLCNWTTIAVSFQRTFPFAFACANVAAFPTTFNEPDECANDGAGPRANGPANCLVPYDHVP